MMLSVFSQSFFLFFFRFFRSALDTLVADNFPLSSREFAESNPKYSDYIAALDKVCIFKSSS
jgi:hypothetical protein